MIVQHSAKSVEWGTPDHVLDRCRTVFGGDPEFDPASSYLFNLRVRARLFLEREGHLLKWPYCDSVLVNPPGNGPHEDNMPAKFWAALMVERDAWRSFGHAIWIGFTLEHLRHCQFRVPMVRFPFCVPAKRLQFVRQDGTAGKSPGHANVIVYVPGRVDKTDLFRTTFADLGACT